MDIEIGIDGITGSPMWRELDYFKAGVKEPIITVFYRQWLVSPLGVRYNEINNRKYFVMDIPAVTQRQLITPEVLDEDGITIITPAVYEDVIITPANNQYTSWRRKIIIQQYVGATLGDDIIIGSINNTLLGLPTDVIDGHIITGA